VTTILGRRRLIRGMGDAEKPSPPERADNESMFAVADAASVGADAGSVRHEGNVDAASRPQPTPRRGEGALRQRSLAERTAINTVVQGSEADLIKLAMINIYRRMRAEHLASRMLLQNHDELIFEAPPEEIELMVQLAKDEMSGVWPLSVSLKVDVKTGSNWADCEPWA
jgi:DNA polymerase I-like protein with 3'-5' exonuclease and polymerase domains